MPLTKEYLLKQTDDCRRRVDLLLDLKKDVDTCIDLTCTRIREELAKAENGANTADPIVIRQMITVVRNARKLIKDYEEGLERIRVLHEDDDFDFNGALPGRLDDDLLSTRHSMPFDRMQLMDHHNGIMQPTPAQAANHRQSTDVGSLIDMGEPSMDTAASILVATVEPIQQLLNDLTLDAPEIASEPIALASPEQVVAVAADLEAATRGTRSASLSNNSADSGYVDQQGTTTAPIIDSEIGVDHQIAATTQIIDAEIGTASTVELIQVERHEVMVATVDQCVSVVPKPTAPVQPEPQEEVQIPADYRLHVVSKGNVNGNDLCQRSVHLGSTREEPLLCKVSHVESPSLFWVQPITSNLEKFVDEMNSDLDEMARGLNNPKIGDYCVAPVEENDYMHRAKILEIKDNASGTSYSKVLYIDTGKVDWVATKSLLEMPREGDAGDCRLRERQACPCMLAEVEPISGTWSPEVIEVFRQVCNVDGKNLKLAVSSLDHDGDAAVNTVTLTRIRNDDMLKPESILVQVILLSKLKVKRSDPVVPMKAFELENGEPIGGGDPPDINDGWRCDVRALAQPEENPEQTEAEMALETAERAARRAALAAACADKFVPKIFQGTVRELSLDQAGDDDGTLYFHVTEAMSPYEFYIQICDKYGRNDALDQLARDLNSFYSVPSNRMPLKKADAQFAIVEQTIDGVSAFRRILVKEWRINRDSENKDIRVNSTARVIFVDFGTSDDLPTSAMFVLDKRFCALSAQAAFCKLFEVMPNSATGEWERQSQDIFNSLVTSGKPLMKGTLMSNERPAAELVVTKFGTNGGLDVCINAALVESKNARSNIEWPPSS